MIKGKVGYIWGRRILGDLQLDRDPVAGRPSRILLGEKLTNVEQDYEEQSVTPRYSIGSKMIVDERTFHYCRAGTAIVPPGTYRLSITVDLDNASNGRLSIAPAMVIGDSTVTVDVAAGPAFQGGVVLADELVGGWIEVAPVAGAGFRMWRRIIANTATGIGTSIIITVDRPFNRDVGIGSGIEVHPSIYRDVRMTPGYDPGLITPVCLAPIPVTVAWYFWGQTYGPCWLAPGGNMARSGAYFDDVYFWQNGCYALLSDFGGYINAGTHNADIEPMRIGRVMARSTPGGPGSNMIHLELDP